eukprot:2093440-Rhodomonas_salina.1
MVSALLRRAVICCRAVDNSWMYCFTETQPPFQVACVSTMWAVGGGLWAGLLPVARRCPPPGGVRADRRRLVVPRRHGLVSVPRRRLVVPCRHGFLSVARGRAPPGCLRRRLVVPRRDGLGPFPRRYPPPRNRRLGRSPLLVSRRDGLGPFPRRCPPPGGLQAGRSR